MAYLFVWTLKILNVLHFSKILEEFRQNEIKYGTFSEVQISIRFKSTVEYSEILIESSGIRIFQLVPPIKIYGKLVIFLDTAAFCFIFRNIAKHFDPKFHLLLVRNTVRCVEATLGKRVSESTRTSYTAVNKRMRTGPLTVTPFCAH